MGLGLGWPLISKILIFLINTIGLGLLFLVYFSNPKAKLNRIFALMVFLMFIWVNCAFLARLSGKEDLALVWIRIAWAITLLFFALIYSFIFYFTKEQKKYYRYLSTISLFIGVIFIFFVFLTDLIIKDIQFRDGVLYITYGKLIFLFFGMMFFLTISSFTLLFKKYLEPITKQEKKKIKYLLIGFFFFFLMNSIFNIFYPVFLKIANLYEFGDYSTIFLIAAFAYTIVRRELFGIKIAFTTTLVSVIVILLALDIFAFTPQPIFRLYKSLILVLFIYFAYLLIKSFLREIKYRQKIKKAYDLEKKAHKELERLDTAKTQFMMATQHHLRTPLTAMIGYLDLIFSGTYGKINPKLKDALLKFQASAQRLNSVVDELLDVSRFQLGKKVITPQPNVSIAHILRGIVEELKIEAKVKGIYLKLLISKDLPLITADKEKLRVALANIIDNAVKYTSKGGVMVEADKTDSKVLIKVKDTGMGIPKEDQKDIFNRVFERGKGASKANAVGKGIGLYITYHIIKAHYGNIWVESEGKNKGTTFYIELPIEQPKDLEEQKKDKIKKEKIDK